MDVIFGYPLVSGGVLFGSPLYTTGAAQSLSPPLLQNQSNLFPAIVSFPGGPQYILSPFVPSDSNAYAPSVGVGYVQPAQVPYMTDVKTIIDKLSLYLGDVSNSYWSRSELLGWINDGQLELVNLLPRTNVRSYPVRLSAGIRQTLPVDAIELIDIQRNKGMLGTTDGGLINRVDLERMRKRLPNWTIAAPASDVKHYIYEHHDPLHFDVYPPQPSTPAYVMLMYSALPTVIPDYNPGTKITIPDYYQNPLFDYAAYRAKLKDSEAGNQSQTAMFHYNQFKSALGVRIASDDLIDKDALPRK
jgi:hypothetical protein